MPICIYIAVVTGNGVNISILSKNFHILNSSYNIHFPKRHFVRKNEAQKCIIFKNSNKLIFLQHFCELNEQVHHNNVCQEHILFICIQELDNEHACKV